MAGMDFSIGDLYPSMSPFSTTETTVPEAEEQQVLEQSDKERPQAVNGVDKNNFWIGLIILLVILFILHA